MVCASMLMLVSITNLHGSTFQKRSCAQLDGSDRLARTRASKALAGGDGINPYSVAVSVAPSDAADVPPNRFLQTITKRVRLLPTPCTAVLQQ
ncbi:hypothetical protein XAB3213_4400024 [Xanthomonas citri pv. bilvae]|nr:hypothetical protein XAB3213_4400024 [Xanthomonas citri pv. bilvae]